MQIKVLTNDSASKTKVLQILFQFLLIGFFARFGLRLSRLHFRKQLFIISDLTPTIRGQSANFVSVVCHECPLVNFKQPKASCNRCNQIAQIQEVFEPIFELVGIGVLLFDWSLILPFVVFGHRLRLFSKDVYQTCKGIA